MKNIIIISILLLITISIKAQSTAVRIAGSFLDRPYSTSGRTGMNFVSGAIRFDINSATAATFPLSGGFNFGSGTFTATAGVVNAQTGFRINDVATSGNYLRGNGTNLVLSGLLPADLTQSGASTNQVLGWNGSIWTPQTNTSESTSIGSFNNSGTSNGLSLSGTALSLHAATISTPGAVNTGQQTFTSGAGSKYFNGTGTAQISVDGNTDATEAGINFTQVGGADIMAQMQVNSSDVDNARFQLLIEDAGSYVPKLIIGSLNDQKGVQESGGLYEEVTNVTSSPYAVIYGDRNIYLDGATITVNLQAIGTSTGETKIGRVIYFFNDNATNVTITPNGSETIADAASLTLLPNTGVTLLAVTGTQWAIRD